VEAGEQRQQHGGSSSGSHTMIGVGF